MRLKKLILFAMLVCPICVQAYPHLSPYTYCAGQPVNYIDPTGCRVEGVTKEDASMVVEDFRTMFPGDDLANFRQLIVQSGKKQNGKSLAKISSDALSAALNGVNLTDDQLALVEMVVNTINSDDVHKVEYVTSGNDMSKTSLDVYVPKLNSLGITSEMAENTRGGYSQFVMALCGEASTVPIPAGSLSIIQKNSETFVTNRPATLGHEVIGHGRAFRLGYTDQQSQHVLPIQVENLILRNMGLLIFRNGTDHAPLNTFISNFMSIPNFR